MTQPNFITVFADATVDTAFKRIFGTEQFKDATIGLLNSFIEGREIKDVTFLNTEILPDAYDGKKSIIDILCTDTDGARFIVEMQKAKQNNFFQRTFYYSCKLIASYEGNVGEWDYSLKPTFVLSLLDFDPDRITMDERLKGKRIMNFKTVETSCGAQLPQSTEFVFAAIGNNEKKLCEMSDNKEIWLSLLRNSRDMEDIPDSLKDDRMFRTFFEGSRMANFTKEQVTQYTKDMMNDWDIANAKREACEEARAEGRAKGLAEGKAEGKSESQREIAKKMLSNNIEIEMISKCTGLTEKEIKAL